ncbi:hypothetical protein Pelo_16402 [Pelomyxa schiedti]|nr:hypothetical protein Pelo_16402 [Pelomyxa schiedti]
MENRSTDPHGVTWSHSMASPLFETYLMMKYTSTLSKPVRINASYYYCYVHILQQVANKCASLKYASRRVHSSTALGFLMLTSVLLPIMRVGVRLCEAIDIVVTTNTAKSQIV